jgi:hypothetical protein
MGTSSARWAPTGKLWRSARGAARRYLAPEAGGVVARELVARYVAALGASSGEEAQGALAAFRLTRKAAQNFGAWAGAALARGRAAALADLGLPDLEGQPPEVMAQALVPVLAGQCFDLESEVARTSLASLLLQILSRTSPEPADSSSQEFSPSSDSPAASWVRAFLAAALYQRLVLDLGAAMEEAAAGWGHLQAGLDGLKDWLAQAGAEAEAEAPAIPASPEQWRGLAGWVWVTKVLEALLSRVGPFA